MSNPKSKQVLVPTSGHTAILLKTKDACKVLGGIHCRSLARLEAKGFIHSVKLMRHKLYAFEDLQKLVSELQSWNPVKKEELP